ncbi:hypothetical protein BDZ94DRAFT_74376 [Collybia nuda]|uniref:F-box domain-containing protein n=1 Tax=Collybia nuda TaxID=64659 RepID=A0A9P5XX67_9AGAR|nr:hypothetical protein BDZ94DRAFT_74376 [Collybia nuda]
MAATLGTIPQEVLEHIAFFSATQAFLGPPSALVPLLSTCRRIHSRLSINANHHLYANVFAHKFDIAPVIRRLGPDRTTPYILARELQRRCFYLKRIRGRLDSTVKVSREADDGDYDGGTLHGLLSNAYILMLENEGKNEQQLREYGKIDTWLKDYWFEELGASRAKASIRMDIWLPDTGERSLAMWLFWFLLKPNDYMKDNKDSWTALNILKVFALGAHKYDLTRPSWVDFAPVTSAIKAKAGIYYSEAWRLTPPPLATPAILSYLTLVNQLTDGVRHTPLTPSHSSVVIRRSHEWECEWGRCLSLGQPDCDKLLTDSFRPGSIEGVWEGVFTYTEFTAYAALLTGAPPQTLQKSIVVRHRQTWKLREHHLIAADPYSDSGIDMDLDTVDPLPAGDPLRSYFPTGTQIREHREGIEVQEANCKNILHYQRARTTSRQRSDDDCYTVCVQDVIITGEGHSAWGQFNLIGRIRPCDGFVSLSKEYVDGDRGKWLYRGYLVGNIHGNLAGRWRDTLSPADVPGYEGCFAMSRRR